MKLIRKWLEVKHLANGTKQYSAWAEYAQNDRVITYKVIWYFNGYVLDTNSTPVEFSFQKEAEKVLNDCIMSKERMDNWKRYHTVIKNETINLK